MEKTIERIVDYARKVADPESIYLFESMAQGSNNEYSDLDLLIVLAEKKPTKQIIELVKNFAAAFCLKADILVFSNNEIQTLAKSPGSFVATVLKTAKIVYKNG